MRDFYGEFLNKTQAASIAYDPQVPSANNQGTVLEAVTKDQLNTGLKGQIRYSISERNPYAYLFGVTQPIAHVMGYLVSILRERIANFEAPARPEQLPPSHIPGVFINDLRKNLSDLNRHMEQECRSSVARYTVLPWTRRSSPKSIRRPRWSRLWLPKGRSRGQLLKQLAAQLTILKQNGSDSLRLYLRNIKLKLFSQAKRVVLEADA